MLALLNEKTNARNKFWELFPQYKIPKEYKKLYDADKSTGKADSSVLMWTIALLVEKKDNPYKERDKEAKKLLIEDDFVGGKVNWNKLENAIKFWIEGNMTVVDKYLMDLQDKLEERREFLLKEKYTIDNAKELDTLFINTDKLVMQYEAMRNKIEAEGQDKGAAKGGRVESLSESGTI